MVTPIITDEYVAVNTEHVGELLGGWYDDYADELQPVLDQFETLEGWVGSFNGHLVDADSYQGLNIMNVLRRKSDGKLFGFQYWESISKHGEPFYESNSDDFPEFELPAPDTDAEDFDWDEDYFSYTVWTPVEPVIFVGYRHPEA